MADYLHDEIRTSPLLWRIRDHASPRWDSERLRLRRPTLWGERGPSAEYLADMPSGDSA
jgi:hypothetical protein